MAFNFLLTDGVISVDLTALEEIAGNEISLTVQPIIQIFLNNMPETIAKMNAFYAAKDWDNLYKTAHFAKSSVSIIQVDDVYQLCQTIEVNAKKQIELHIIENLIQLIEEKYLRAEKLLTEALQNLPAE